MSNTLGVLGVVAAILAALAAVVAAIAAVFAAWFTRKIMQSGTRQVEISQDQFVQAVKAQKDEHLPVLMPASPLYSANIGDVALPGRQGGTPGYDRNKDRVSVAIENAGQGLALNIQGAIYPPEPEPQDASIAMTGHVHKRRFGLPLRAGERIPETEGEGIEWLDYAPILPPTTVIGDAEQHTQYSLWAPRKPTVVEGAHGAVEMRARLTLTYADIFGRKHAAIYDLTKVNEWVNVTYLNSIPADVSELERPLREQQPVYQVPDIPRG